MLSLSSCPLDGTKPRKSPYSRSPALQRVARAAPRHQASDPSENRPRNLTRTPARPPFHTRNESSTHTALLNDRVHSADNVPSSPPDESFNQAVEVRPYPPPGVELATSPTGFDEADSTGAAMYEEQDSVPRDVGVYGASFDPTWQSSGSSPPRGPPAAVLQPVIPQDWIHQSGGRRGDGKASIYDRKGSFTGKAPPFDVPSPPPVHRQASSHSGSSRLPLRSILRSRSEVDMRHSAGLDRRRSSRLEEGGIQAQRGVFANLIKLYGLTTHRGTSQSAMGLSATNGSRSRASSLDSAVFPTARAYGASRTSSVATEGEGQPLDPDDPRLTGVKINRIDDEKHAQETFVTQAPLAKWKKRRASIKYHICCTSSIRNLGLQAGSSVTFLRFP